MRRTAVAAALCFAAACGTDPSAPPAESSSGMGPTPRGLADASATCVPGLPGDAKFRKHPSWDCNKRIRVTSTNSTLRAAIDGAIAIWNGVYGHNELPVFVTTATPTPAFTVDVEWGSQTGQYYCGTTNLSTRDITINRSTSQETCGGAAASNPVLVADLHKLIAHELSHSIGFGHLSENGTMPAADHCVASLPDAGGLNGGLCQLEILHVKYYYGMYDDYVEPSTYIAHGLEVGGQTTANQGESKTLTAFPQWDGVPPTSLVRYTWSSADASIAQVSLSVSATNAVQAVSPGTTTIRARITGSTYLVLDPQSGDVQFTVNPPAPPPPTGLNATSITYNSATIRWTSGAADATTNLYYKRSSVTSWTDSVTGITAGTTSRQLSNLAGQTSYDVRAKHVRSGQSSSFTSTIQFTTLAPPVPTITNFRVTGCTQQQAGGKTYNYFTMAWDATPNQTTGSYQIGMHNTNSSAAAAVILTVPATTETGVVGGYLSSPLLMNRWFWVRYSRPGATTGWVALTGNPLASNQCLQ